MEIYKIFRIDTAHRLPNVPENHKCYRIHGHTFTIQVYVNGPIHPKFGWVIDFADISKAFKPILEQLDHKFLNEVPGLENPTSENLAKWIWMRVRPILPIMTQITVQESTDSGVIYKGED